MVNLGFVKKIGFLPLVIFAGGLVFLVFSIFARYGVPPKGFNPTHSSRILTLKLRLEAIERARAEGKSDYKFVIKGSFPSFNPFDGVSSDEIRQSS